MYLFFLLFIMIHKGQPGNSKLIEGKFYKYDMKWEIHIESATEEVELEEVAPKVKSKKK